MKLVIFALPDVDPSVIIPALNEALTASGVITKVTILGNEDLQANISERTKLMVIVDDLIKMYGNPANPAVGCDIFLTKIWEAYLVRKSIDRIILEEIAKPRLTDVEESYLTAKNFMRIRSEIIKFLKLF